MNNDLMFSSVSAEWETPQDLFNEYNSIYKFSLDVCATDKNAKCNQYFTKDNSCLDKEWYGSCWMNPPYGREIGKFVKKAYEESQKGNTVVCLLPARTDTKWFHDYCIKGDIRFIKGRLKFTNRMLPSYNEDGNMKISPAPFPSMIVIFVGAKENK